MKFLPEARTPDGRELGPALVAELKRMHERLILLNTQLKTVEVEVMQRVLTERGFYKDKVDGRAGMLTRSALGAYQKANGLKLDCWPTAAVLGHMQGRSGN